jgi:hypothetical protein
MALRHQSIKDGTLSLWEHSVPNTTSRERSQNPERPKRRAFGTRSQSHGGTHHGRILALAHHHIQFVSFILELPAIHINPSFTQPAVSIPWVPRLSRGRAAPSAPGRRPASRSLYQPNLVCRFRRPQKREKAEKLLRALFPAHFWRQS